MAARYGDELAQLIEDELREGRGSVRWRVDVIAHGLWTRLACTGLAGEVGTPGVVPLLSALAALLAVFAMFGVGIWSELAVGWRWATPSSPGSRVGFALMSAAILGCVVLALAGFVPFVGAAILQVKTGGGQRLWRPLLLLMFCGAVLYGGYHYLAPRWPGGGGASGIVPSWVQQVGWSLTLWLNAYWAHPDTLGTFPTSELLWMAVSPLALFIAVCCITAIVRRTENTPLLRRWSIVTGSLGVAAMIVFLAGAVSWLTSHDASTAGLFSAGTVDLVTVALLGVTLALATSTLTRARSVPLPGRDPLRR